MTLVASHVSGSWWTPSSPADATELVDASTGAALASVSVEGIDLFAAVEYGRSVGQRGLQALTFHQRALKLKELAQYLNGKRDELYEVSAQTGATKIDSMVDIDGGIGVLFTYGSKGRRELPNAKVVVDGPVEVLSKDGSFLGQHIYTSLPGVAVQINAFNFPVWGMLEKFAPAFLAGVPTIVKPATPTVYLAETAVRHILESGILPEGSLQLVSGPARGLLDLLDYRDTVGFTGSASTAHALRSHRNVVEGGVRFTAEADSLNAAILGPDATPDTPEFDAYVKSLVTEMTVKAGQKCISIRRVIVPNAAVDDVIEAVRERIMSRVVVGDPRAEGVTMGALVSVGERDGVRARVRELVAAGGELVIGSLDEPEVLLADGTRGIAADGAFMEPVLLRFADARTPAVHSIEAFGPVASIIGYDTVADAIDLAAMGSGSLVATVATHDTDIAREVVLGIAAQDRKSTRLNSSHVRISYAVFCLK